LLCGWLQWERTAVESLNFLTLWYCTMYIGAAYCRSSMVCHDHEPCKNGWTDRDTRWTQVSSRKHRTLVPPDECDWTIHVWPWCDLMSDYFDRLFTLWNSFTPRNERIITSL